MGVLALLVVQAASWQITPDSVTVGDTVWIEQRIAVGAGARARVEPFEPTETVEPLMGPAVESKGDVLVIRYAVALFEPGRITLTLPAIEVQYPDGRATPVPATTTAVTVWSVLPQTDPRPDPKPSLGPFPRFPTRWLPLVLLVGVVLAALVGWAIRRQWPRPRPVWRTRAHGEGAAPTELWAEAGEPRAVAAAVAAALRSRMAEELPAAAKHLEVGSCLEVIERDKPDWPVRELREVLTALDRVRFAPAVSNEIRDLTRRAEALADELQGTASEVAS